MLRLFGRLLLFFLPAFFVCISFGVCVCVCMWLSVSVSNVMWGPGKDKEKSRKKKDDEEEDGGGDGGGKKRRKKREKERDDIYVYIYLFAAMYQRPVTWTLLCCSCFFFFFFSFYFLPSKVGNFRKIQAASSWNVSDDSFHSLSLLYIIMLLLYTTVSSSPSHFLVCVFPRLHVPSVPYGVAFPGCRRLWFFGRVCYHPDRWCVYSEATKKSQKRPRRQSPPSPPHHHHRCCLCVKLCVCVGGVSICRRVCVCLSVCLWVVGVCMCVSVSVSEIARFFSRASLYYYWRSLACCVATSWVGAKTTKRLFFSHSLSLSLSYISLSLSLYS